MNYVGLGPLDPSANVPSERHHFGPHDHGARLCPSLPFGEPGPPSGDALALVATALLQGF